MVAVLLKATSGKPACTAISVYALMLCRSGASAHGWRGFFVYVATKLVAKP